MAEGKNGAFVERFEIPATGTGTLDRLTFAVKDIIDLGGYVMGGGNPDWRETHTVAATNAVCVDQLLNAGAACVGKAITDELAFSLLGENHFYGTPPNPRAPDRVPGGSSSGSASAVAQGLADFALGTDTGGSVRVPASNCGVWGMRPSHGVVSVAGVMPFAPTFDTVGVLASSADVLTLVASVLLSCEPEPVAGTIHLVDEAFSTSAPEVGKALEGTLDLLKSSLGCEVGRVSIEEMSGGDMASWMETYGVLQWAEIWSSLGAWVEETDPSFGPEATQNFDLVRNLDRRRVPPAARLREDCFRRINASLGPDDLLCMPTTPEVAPVRGTVGPRGSATAGDYYPRTLAMTSIAGIGRLPQVSMPLGEVGGVPIGLSLLAAHGRDALLLDAARKFDA